MITQITNNYNSVNNLVATPPQLETATDQNKQKHAIHKNRLVIATCKQQTPSIMTTDYITNTFLKKTIETNDVCLFKSMLYSEKNISVDFKNSAILTKYTSLIIDYKADACLIELLDFLLKKNIKQVLDHNYDFYYYIRENPQLQQTILNKYYYAVGCLQIYNMLRHAIYINNKDVAIQTFNILLKKFPIDYTAKQYINKYHNPIVYAIEQDKFDIFQKLLDMAPKYFASIIENDATPLMAAAQNKNSGFLKAVIKV